MVGMVDEGLALRIDKAHHGTSFAIPSEIFKEIYPALEFGPQAAPGDLPPGSHVPFTRNAFFTGRAADLEKLAEVLLGEVQAGVVVNQAIIGMGGLGKTQLAVEFAYRYGSRFKGVYWLDLAQPDSLEARIVAAGEKMGLRPWSNKQPEQAALTLKAWQTDGPRPEDQRADLRSRAPQCGDPRQQPRECAARPGRL